MINQSTAGGLKGISRAILTAVIAFIAAIGIFASTAFADLVSQYNVEIIVDNSSVVITTNETEPIEILSQANITLNESDKLDISGFTSGKGGSIKIDKKNTINIEFDGVISSYGVYADNVNDAFNEIGLNVSANDKVNYALTDEIKDGMVITIKSAMSVTLNVDGKSTKYAIYQGTVKDLISLAQITLGDDDYTVPAMNEKLQANMSVTVYRVETKLQTVKEQTNYRTVAENDDSMTKGTQVVASKGVKGEDEVTYEVKYVNGKEESKTELIRKTVSKPVDEVVKIGTKKLNGADVTSNGVTSKNGYTVGQTITGRYTHYCACATCNGNSNGITSSGKRISNGMENPYYIACNWLPLGSVINVDGTNYTVVDRGGSGLSSVGRIDIFTPEGHSACYKYGTGSCTIEIVRLGW